MSEAVKVISNILYFFYLWIEGIFLSLLPNSFRYKELRGETVLITGGGSGIGRLLALRFARHGCRVVIWDINKKGNEETCELIKNTESECYSYICDVSKREEVYSTAQRVKDEVGPVTILVNNAGIVSGKMLLDCPDYMIEKTFQVNTISHFWICKSFLPYMMARDHGHIVTIASIAGFVETPKLVDYCASKHAAVGFHESLYLELQKENFEGIKTTLVCPSFTNTKLFAGAESGYFSFMEPDYVADKIISAVRMNQLVLFIPSYISIFAILKSIMPVSVSMIVYKSLKGYNVMEKFKGRNE